MEKKIITCPNCNTGLRVPAGKHVRFVCPTCREKLEFNDKVMASPQEPYNNQTNDDTVEKSSFSGCVVQIIAFIVSFPVFIILHKKLPDLDWVFNLDRILLFILVILIVEVIFNFIKKMVVFLLIGIILLLGYGSLWGNYGFVDLYNDYRTIIDKMRISETPEKVILSELKPFHNKSEIKKAIDYDNSDVRNFALEATRNHFKEYSESNKKYRTLIQVFSVFKEINIEQKWNYVHDPKSREYFAKASETLKHFSGDCDDYAILMVACVKVIGGTPRLVSTSSHLYPEILIGTKDDLKEITYLIKNKLFNEYFSTNLKSRNRYDFKNFDDLNFHTDEQGRVWLNLDYTAKYPGGKFIGGKVLEILEL